MTRFEPGEQVQMQDPDAGDDGPWLPATVLEPDDDMPDGYVLVVLVDGADRYALPSRFVRSAPRLF